ncbi:MAG: glycosyltransferase [Acidimicrobiaceae bacterium]|nr:glycosyltransferase [Acidimicrobiaceae bacterium]
MRVAFYSPLPPERSGIADYSYELLEELRHHVDIVAVVAEKQLGLVRALDGVELVGSAAADDLVVDCSLYQMGNNSKYHRFFYGRAFEEPGLLVMHDPSLADFTAEMCGGAEGAIFRDEVAYDRPDISPADDLPLVDIGNGRKDLDRIQVLLARRILESNVRTLVHSSAMAREMRRRYPNCDVRTIQLPAPVLSEPEWKLRRPPGEVVFGVFGGINYYKRVRPLVDAFLEVRKRHPLARMVIAGRADDHLLERELRAIATRPDLEGSLEVKTDLSLTELEHEMQRCDVGISLRWPTAGEMSATLMRTFGAGRPAIVSDVLQFRELDEQYCWRVTTDFDHEHENLAELMDRLAGDPALCQRAGEAARAFVQREATYHTVAEQYVEHLEHCAARRGALRATRLGSRRRSSLPLGVNIVAPSGSGEIAEAARRTTEALRSAGVDVVVVELAPGSRPTRMDELDREVDELGSYDATNRGADGRGNSRRDGAHVRDETDAERIERAILALDPVDRSAQAVGPHLVDFFFVVPNDSDRYGRLANVRRGRGRRIVGILSPQYVPLPKDLRGFLEVADHVIAPSEFAAEVARLSTIIDVIRVPWPSEVNPPTRTPMPTPIVGGGNCTFLAIARAGTPIAQSNPFATLAAFRRAFSATERGEHARLVVVLEDHPRRPEARAALQSELDALGGQLVVDPSTEELDRIVAGTDVYVSLHRAEGFGLHLVDMMARGKAVIATGWSGNLDFMDRSNSCLVGYEVRDLDPGDLYLDPHEQIEPARSRFWVDPDTGGAARWMQLLASDLTLRGRLGRAASDRMRSQLAPDIVGLAARSCLAKIVAAPPRAEPPRLRPAEWASHLTGATRH